MKICVTISQMASMCGLFRLHSVQKRLHRMGKLVDKYQPAFGFVVNNERRRTSPEQTKNHHEIQILGSILVLKTKYLSPRISGASNGGTEPYKAILEVGFPLHKPYIQLI